MELVVLSGAALLAVLAVLDGRDRSQISIWSLLVLFVLSVAWIACVVACLQGQLCNGNAMDLHDYESLMLQ